MMDEENVKHPLTHEVGMVLDSLSVSELEDRIRLLEAEISRLKSAVLAKGNSRAAADAAFKF
jgi:uncharacterized small protein (DUF1192 family)